MFALFAFAFARRQTQSRPDFIRIPSAGGGRERAGCPGCPGETWPNPAPSSGSPQGRPRREQEKSRPTPNSKSQRQQIESAFEIENVPTIRKSANPLSPSGSCRCQALGSCTCMRITTGFRTVCRKPSDCARNTSKSLDLWTQFSTACLLAR